MKEPKQYLTLNETASLWGVSPSELCWALKVDKEVLPNYLIAIPTAFLPYLKHKTLFSFFMVACHNTKDNPVKRLQKDILENWVSPSKASKMIVGVKAVDIRAMIENGEIGEEDHYPNTFGTQRPLLRKSFIADLEVGKELRNKYYSIGQAAVAWNRKEEEIKYWRDEGFIPSEYTLKSGSGYYYLKDFIDNAIAPTKRVLISAYLKLIEQRKENANENS